MTNSYALPELSDKNDENKILLTKFYHDLMKLQIKIIEGNSRDKKVRAGEVNKFTNNIQNELIEGEIKKFDNKDYDRNTLLTRLLMIKYCSYINMLEYRNYFWRYDYMTLSRRIGEMWEPFCRTCFEYPIDNALIIYKPITFEEVKSQINDSILLNISQNISDDEARKDLVEDINFIWGMVESGQVNLELDFHIEKNDKFYHIDFKSGFRSNEKGNTNRLLLVGNIYKNIIEGDNTCILLVRQVDGNNNYYKRLTSSGIWEGYNGQEAYEKINDLTGFDLKKWIEDNIVFLDDLSPKTIGEFRELDILRFLEW